MAPVIRQLRDEELPAFVDSLSTAFLDRPDIDKVVGDLRKFWDLDRTWGAFEDGRVCGTFRSWGTELTVPGRRRLPGAAVTAVTVLPTHRRRGILRSLVEAAHPAMRERDEAVGLLFAAEYPIYGRFGYGPATRLATITLDAHAATFLGSRSCGVELVAPKAAREPMMTVFDAWRLGQPGEIRRRDYRWDYDLGLREEVWGKTWKGFTALRRSADGSIDGYVRYRAEEKWEHGQPRGILTVDELHALNDEAYASLWRFLAETDLVATIKAEGRRVGERLPWLLTNARAAVISELGDGMWVRLFDIPRALEARSYERTAAVTLEVVDREAPDDRVRVHLDASPDGARCVTTDRTADLTLDVSALGAAYLGGARLGDAVLATGVDEHRAGALAEADALFRTLDEPWCSTFF